MFSSGQHRFLIFLVPVLILGLVPLVAQGEEGEENSRQHIEDDRFVHQTEPVFAIKLPKKFREDWRFVDVFARRDHAQALVEAEMEKAEDDNKKSQLEGRLQRLSQEFDRIKMILENSRSKTAAKNLIQNGMAGVVNNITVEVAPATTVQKISEVKPTQGYTKNWNIIKTVTDKNTTSKRDAKKQRYTHLYEIVATLKQDTNSARMWIRVQTFLIYNKKKTDRYVLTVTHTVPETEATDDVKKDSAKLLGSIKIL